jgi:hypothetical protein
MLPQIIREDPGPQATCRVVGVAACHQLIRRTKLITISRIRENGLEF